MNQANKLEKQASIIADAIVDLVERTDGPVTLARLDREIQGFAEKESPSWEYVVEHDDGETLVWNGMTEAGLAALRKVMSGRMVAVQYLSNPSLYFLEGNYPANENWMPVVLLPVRAANLQTPKWLMRFSENFLDQCMRMAAERGERGYRRLTPSAVRGTADRFTV
jgi:hypothetical protein